MRIFVSTYYHKNRKTIFLKNGMFVGASESKYFDSIIYLKSLYDYYFGNKIRGYGLHQTDIYLLATLIAKDQH